MSDALEASSSQALPPVSPDTESLYFGSSRRPDLAHVANVYPLAHAARILKDTSCLRSLHLIYPLAYEVGQADVEGILCIVPVLIELKHLRGLYIKGGIYSSYRLGPDGARAIALALAGMKNLHSLDLPGNAIGPEGARAIAGALAGMKNLHSLNLSSNAIGPEGARAIAPALAGMKNLRKLDLYKNNLGPEGARALAPALAEMRDLHVLYLLCNDMGPEGARAIALALAGMKNLRELVLAWNELGPEGALAIAPALAEMKNMQRLGLAHNNFGVDGTLAIARTLPEMKDLRYLNFYYYEREIIEARTVATFLASHTELTEGYIHHRVNKEIIQTCQTNKEFLKKAAFVFNELCLNPEGHMLSLELGHLIVNEIEGIVYTQ
jgi:hypothetical protein